MILHNYDTKDIKIPRYVSKETNLTVEDMKTDENICKLKLINAIILIYKRYQPDETQALEATIKSLRLIQVYDLLFRPGPLQTLTAVVKNVIKAPANTYNTPKTNSTKPTTPDTTDKNTQKATEDTIPLPILKSPTQQLQQQSLTYRYGTTTDRTNNEYIQTIRIRKDHHGTVSARPADILSDFVTNVASLARRHIHAASLMTANGDPHGRQHIGGNTLPESDILEKYYVSDISETSEYTTFTCVLCTSFPYNLLKVKNQSALEWNRSKNDHMEYLGSKQMFANTLRSNSITGYNYVPVYAFINSNPSHDSDRMTEEFIELVREQTGISINPRDFTIQDREVFIPTTFDPVIQNAERQQNPEQVAMKTLYVKRERLNDFVGLCVGLSTTNDKRKYPSLDKLVLTDIRTEAYKTKQEWIDNVINPQKAYYDMRLQLIVSGIPKDADLREHIPDFHINNNPNTSTVEELLTGKCILAQRGNENITTSFHKIYPGKNSGSWIFEGHMFEQDDIEYVKSTCLINHLQQWLNPFGRTDYIRVRYSRKNPTYQTNDSHQPSDDERSQRSGILTQLPTEPTPHKAQLHPFSSNIRNTTGTYGPADTSNHSGYHSDRSRTNIAKRRKYNITAHRQHTQNKKSKRDELLIEIIKSQNKRITKLENLVYKNRKRASSPSQETETDSDEENDSDEESSPNSSDDSSDDSSSTSYSSDEDDAPGNINQTNTNTSNKHNNNEKSSDNNDDQPSHQQQDEKTQGHESNSQEDHQHENLDSTPNDDLIPTQRSPHIYTDSEPESPESEIDPNRYTWPPPNYPPIDEHLWYYSDKTDKLMRKTEKEYIQCHDRIHHEYFKRDFTNRKQVPDDIHQVEVLTICEKVIKTDIPTLSEEVNSGETIPINTDNFTQEDVDEMEKELRQQIDMEEIAKERREELLASLSKEDRERSLKVKPDRQKIEPPAPTETVEPLSILICRHCKLITANGTISFHAHQNTCNGIRSTNDFFTDKTSIKKYYSTKQ